MIKDTDLIEVKNRNNGGTGYTLENNFHRQFSPGEVKKVPFSELRQLSYVPGGQFMLDNYLVIENKEALEALNMTVEPEYFYDEQKIRELLFGNNNIDEFADFLDFAPEGRLEIAKTIAVAEQIPDVRKRNMLSERTGLNINNAIMINEILNADDEAPVEETKQRRVPVAEAKAEEPKTPTRRTTPEYKVVKKN